MGERVNERESESDRPRGRASEWCGSARAVQCEDLMRSRRSLIVALIHHEMCSRHPMYALQQQYSVHTPPQ